MKFIVTGGAGFIGSHLCVRLSEEGNEVLAVDNLSTGDRRVPLLEASGVEILEVDIREARFGSELARFSPEAVFHLAAQVDVRKAVEFPLYDADVNILGSINTMEAARECNARVVNTASGGAMYGDLPEGEPPFKEEHPRLPASPYGISKGVVESYLRFYLDAFGLQFVNLALGNVYGPGQDPTGEAGVVSIFGGRLVSNEPCVIYGDGEQTRDYVYVEDVVDAFVAATGKGEGETFNIASGQETSVLKLHSLMSSLTSSHNPPEHAEERTGELSRVALDISKAERGLGWKPSTTLEEGLRRTLDWISGGASHRYLQ